ncbi:MAG: META domain-containing protein [Staphylococcus sp.]|nr:META domain-containing protein [Staphylococcus sp.]
MKLISLFASAIAITSLVSSCGTLTKSGATATNNKAEVTATKVGTSDKKISATDEAQTAPLLGSWAVTNINGKNVVVNGENHPQITFEAIPDAKTAILVIAFNGCNYLNGSWIVKGNKLEPNGEFLSSLKACADAPYENMMNSALNQVATYSIVDDNTVTLNSAAGTALMTLRKRNLSFLNGAWQVTTIQGTPVPANTAIKIVIDIDECKIHGNAGCNVLNGSIVVNLDKGDGIEFKDLATTRMTCPAIATEQSFLLALEQVDTCIQGASTDQAVMKNSQGQPILTLIRISPDQVGEE